MISLEQKKFIIEIITGIVVVISMIISIKSCQVSERAEQVSENSNEIANKALEITQSQFLQINRPYLVVNAKRFDDKNFWKIKQRNNLVEIELKYEIKNVGNVSAIKITTPDIIEIGPKMNFQKDAKVKATKTINTLTLGPGDSFVVSTIFLTQYNNEEDAKKKL